MKLKTLHNEAPLSSSRALTLAVLRHGDGWRVFGPNGGWRRFDYKVDAEEAALRLARHASRDLGEVTVLVQNAWGELRPLWTA
jgi:hypothetical protein